jgi:2-polyprenyl-3-methyl-5-hydroxy-6-metoxy-1,4-benzoquinol methylase
MDEILPWLKSQHLQAREMVDAARLGRLQPGWTHVDPELLQAQGRTGRRSTRAMATHLFPTLQGLQARLESPDAAFLDVGMGVGIISIEMCSIYPKLRAVGLEPGEVQGAEARRNIAEAGLENRIEIRTQGLQDLADREAFDLAFVPQVFIPTTVVRPGLQNVWSALRPGGWVMMIAFDAPGDDLHATTTRLLNVLWGGDPLSLEEVAGMAREAGFEMVQVAGEPGNLIKVVVGRRPL